MSTAVKFENVCKSYPSYSQVSGGFKNFLFHFPSAVRDLNKRRTVLNNVNFSIKQGETFGFIGANGAGKSTILGLMAKVLMPESGKVIVNGRVSPLLELGAGFHPELSGRENIRLNGVLMGLTLAEVLRHEEEIINFSELEPFIHQPVRTYSSGMYAKLGFSVIATLKPEILLVDEILAVGDLAFMRKCEAKIEEFRKNPDITIIMVSHELGMLSNLCDNAAWIENGMIRKFGEANSVVEAYIGKVQKNNGNKTSYRNKF